MTAAMAMPGNTAETFLVHFFGTGLADDRYVVERFKARADGDIVPARPRRSRRRAGARRSTRWSRAERPRRCVRTARRSSSAPVSRPAAAASFGVRSRPESCATANRRVDGPLPGRPAGPPRSAPATARGAGATAGRPSSRYPNSTGGAPGWPTAIRQSERRKTASVSPNAPPRASKPACAPGAAGPNPCRAPLVRPLQRQAERGEPRARRPAPGRGQAAPRPGPGKALRARAQPPGARGAQGGRHLHQVRPAAGTPERTTCEPCAEQHRARDRARHARAKAEGIPYGGRDPEARRRAGRKRSRRRSEARKEAGLCIRCGHVAPEEGRTMCEPCRQDRRAAKRARHAERRAAGLCVNCATPAPGGKTYCEPCAKTRSRRRNLEAKREADRRRYAERRARGDCTSCGKPANGAAECQACCDAARCPLRRPPGRRGLRQVPGSHLRRDGLLRALRRRQGRAARPRGGITPPGAPGTPIGGPGGAASTAMRRRRGWRVASPVRAGTARARGRFAASPSGTHLDGDRDRTGREHGPYDSEADVALCLAFEKLAHHEVEVLCDASPMSFYTAPPW